MNAQLIVSIILLVALTLLAIDLYTKTEKLTNMLNEKEDELIILQDQIKILNSTLKKTNENLVNTLNTVQKISERYENLSKEYQILNNSYQKLFEDYRLLEGKYNKSKIQNVSPPEWEIFKNLSKWFRENSEFYDQALKERIMKECSDMFTIKVPCSIHLIKQVYGYNNKVDEFNSVKRMMEQGYGDCKSHALMLKALLQTLPDYMFVEAMRKVPLIDAPYFSYIVYDKIAVQGYTSHMFGRLTMYDKVVVCFNTQRSGHCAVALSPVNISSYKDIRAGYAIDPLTGEVIGELGKDITICENSECKNKPGRILMVISNNWIDYYDETWKRLQS